MKNVGFIYDDIFLMHETPAGHPEKKERLIHILSTLQISGLWDKLIHIKPRRAGYDDIALVHAQDYIEKIENRKTGYLDPDTYMSEYSLEAALYAAGALIEAVETVPILPWHRGRFRPDIILISAGYDIHKDDPLAGIRVSNEGMRSVMRSILLCSSRPMVFALEGGYDLTSLGESVKITIEEMLGNNFFL